jgi:hypothetical protein
LQQTQELLPPPLTENFFAAFVFLVFGWSVVVAASKGVYTLERLQTSRVNARATGSIQLGSEKSKSRGGRRLFERAKAYSGQNWGSFA